MASRCVVKRIDPDEPKTNNADGYEVDNWVAIHTALPVTIGGSSGSDGGSRSITIGSVVFEEATGVAKFPATTTDLQDNDVFEVTDGEWPGAMFRIVAAIVADGKTARRIPIVEASRPNGWS